MLKGTKLKTNPKHRKCTKIFFCKLRLVVLYQYFYFKFKFCRALPCCFALDQWRAEKGQLVTFLILLPHLTALFMTSLTAGHKIPALVVVILCLSTLDFQTGWQIDRKINVCSLFMPLLSIKPVICLGFGSPLSYNTFVVFHFRCIPVEAEHLLPWEMQCLIYIYNGSLVTVGIISFWFFKVVIYCWRIVVIIFCAW